MVRDKLSAVLDKPSRCAEVTSSTHLCLSTLRLLNPKRRKMLADFTYSVFHVSKTDVTPSVALQYRALRLDALKISPDSFSSTYEIESGFEQTVWEQRILEDARETFVCVATHNHSDEMRWVGQLTLRGPISRSEFTLPEESGQPLLDTDEREEKWQLLSLFNLPEHRGQGLGQKLCQEALLYLQNHRPVPSVLVRLMVKPQNVETVRLYQKLGFRVIGKCTLGEALMANGDAHLLPADYSEKSKYTIRSGLIMTFRVSRT